MIWWYLDQTRGIRPDCLVHSNNGILYSISKLGEVGLRAEKMRSSIHKFEFLTRIFVNLHVELSLVSLADRLPLCCALLEQLGRPLVGLRHTLAFFVEKPEIIHRALRLEL